MQLRSSRVSPDAEVFASVDQALHGVAGMMSTGFSAKAAILTAVLVACGSVAACGDDGASAAAGAGTASLKPPTYPVSRSSPDSSATALQIQGSPATSASVGQPYAFQPSVPSAASAALKFSIANSPSWAKFDPATGKLTGTPGATQVGTYPGITISALVGTTTAVLPAFTIVVAEGNSQSNVTLSWQPPTENADGTSLIDLKGFKVHYGAKSKSYSATIQVTNPGLTTYVVQNLAAGMYYFAVTAYNSTGVESSLSPEISTQVD